MRSLIGRPEARRLAVVVRVVVRAGVQFFDRPRRREAAVGGHLSGRRLIADDFAVAFNDQFCRIILVKYSVAGFERNPNTRFRSVRIGAMGDADSVVYDEHVDAVAFD